MELEQLWQLGVGEQRKLQLFHDPAQRQDFSQQGHELFESCLLAGREAPLQQVCMQVVILQQIYFQTNLSIADSCNESRKVQSKGGRGRPRFEARREMMETRRGEALAVMEG